MSQNIAIIELGYFHFFLKTGITWHEL